MPIYVPGAAPSGSFVGVKAYQTSGQSVNSATQTLLTWDAEEFDSNGFHDNVTNNSRFTVPSGQDGYYMFGANLVWTVGLADQTRCFINLLKNGTLIRGGRAEVPESGTSAEPSPACSVLVQLAATDYVEVQVHQSSGSAKTISVTAVAAWLVKQ